ncbi:MAG: hypothetical protein MJ016_06060 [Victivallaceae bacterium]|nr:hypothetical protein [Victivallaceae bacterium]
MKHLVWALVFAATLCGAAQYRIEGEKMRCDDGWIKGVGGTDGSILYAGKKGLSATGIYILPEPGTYTIWVHGETRNENWRKAQLRINGISFGEFGDDREKDFKKPHFYWKKMALPLCVAASRKAIRIEVVSLAGGARFDSLILSDDPDFDPGLQTDEEITNSVGELKAGK